MYSESRADRFPASEILKRSQSAPTIPKMPATHATLRFVRAAHIRAELAIVAIRDAFSNERERPCSVRLGDERARRRACGAPPAKTNGRSRRAACFERVGPPLENSG
ncbi:MAG: hypothetical protein NVS2B3_04980 [Vulcanimicrobiaceae bacterium]